MGVSICQIHCGPVTLGARLLHPEHKKKLERFCSRVFKDEFQKNPMQEIHIESQKGNFMVQVGKDRKDLNSLKGTKEITRVFEYYQNMGLIPKPSLFPGVSPKTMIKESERAVKAIDEASIPGVNGSMYAGSQLTEQALTATRNFLYAMPISVFESRHKVIDHLGYYGGVFWGFFGLRELDDGLVELQRSELIQDKEGVTRGKLKVASGSIVSAGAASFLGGKVTETFRSVEIGRAMEAASGALFCVGSAIAAGSSMLGVLRCHTFSGRLQEYLEHPHFKEKEKLIGALEFLKDSLFITEKEFLKEVDQIAKDNPLMSSTKKQHLLNLRLASLAESKAKYVKRRCGVKSLCFLSQRVHLILQKLRSSKNQADGVREAKELLALVQVENKVKKVLHEIGVVAALVSLVAMALMLFHIGGTVPVLLYAITTTVYLIMSIYWIGCIVIRQGQKYIELAKVKRMQKSLDFSV